MERMLARTHDAHWYSTRLFSVTIDQPSGKPSSGTVAWMPHREHVLTVSATAGA